MRILVVDDEPDVAALVAMGIRYQRPEHQVTEVHDGQRALDAIGREHPDVVVLDLAMPGKDGLAVLRELRDRGDDVPVIVLTAKGLEHDKVRGLEAGADDYVGKPFDHLELMARVRAVLRRLDLKAPAGRAASYRNGDLEIDADAREVRLAGSRVAFTPTEWRILELLVANAGWIVPHERLLARVWGRDEPGDLESLRVFVRRLRAKLGDDAGAPRFIETVRGVGYRLLSGK